jgi:bifunctional non-homologous end joining protein LigD
MMPVLPGLDLIPPMLAAAGPLPASSGYAYEFKYDGVRLVAYVSDGEVRGLSRNGNDVTASYPEVSELTDLVDGHRVILDGEIVALEPGDRPSFARLQQRIHQTRPTTALLGAVPVVYYVFDILHIDGQDLTPMPYTARRDVLAGLTLHGNHVRMPVNFLNVEGATVLKAAGLGGLEGVVAKKLTSPYRPGKRAADAWIKVPLIRTQEVLVVGWRPGEGRRLGLLGSLLVAIYDEHDQLVYAGKVGTGFTDRMLRDLEAELKPLARTTPPAPDVPREDSRNAHWVEPVLIAEVQFRSWTPDGRLRHPSWRGLRTDRSVSSVRRAPEPVPYPPQGDVIGALETPDGRWRVEAIRRGRDQFYRLIHGDNVVDGLVIATVERLLGEAGVDLGDLVEVSLGVTNRARQAS